MKILKLLLPLSIILSGCIDNDMSKSSDKEIISFQVYNYSAIIDEYQKQIELVVPSDMNLEKIEPTIKISRKATIFPASDVEQDFTKAVIYTVRAEDGSEQQYTVNITREKSSSARIQSFSINGIKGDVKDDWTTIYHTGANSIQIWLKGVTDVTKLKPIIEVSQGAKVSPASGAEVDFSRPVTYTVTAENGNVTSYTVGVQYSTFPSGLLYVTEIRNTNKTKDVTTNYSFDCDHFNRLKYFSKTTKPYYIDNSLVDGNIVYIKYGDNGKISQLILEEKENNSVTHTRTLNVSYPDNRTVYVTEQIAGGSNKQDVIILNDKDKVWKFETNSETELFVYDKFDNLIELTTVNHGYKKITYDNYNSIFTYFNAPHWTLLYTTEELIGSGINNPISIDTYKQNGELAEAINYDYKYDTRTRYPKSYNYQVGNEAFSGVVFLSFVFPYSLNLRQD